jgi:undecaprenyl-diphosphatase
MIDTLARVVDRIDRAIEDVLRWDAETLLAISEQPFLKRLSRLFIVATHLGDGYLWGALALGLILFGRPIDRTYVLIALSVTIVNIAVFRLFKLLFERPRPAPAIVGIRSRLIDVYSFPSGHATTAFGIVWVIAVHYPHLLFQLPAYFVAIAIGLSRVYLKEHYPLDVIGGALLGSFVAAYLVPLLGRLLL